MSWPAQLLSAGDGTALGSVPVRRRIYILDGGRRMLCIIGSIYTYAVMEQCGCIGTCLYTIYAVMVSLEWSVLYSRPTLAVC